MFAVVRTGGKQYRVAAGDKIVVEKMSGEAGETISLGDVLLAGEGSELRNVEGLLVTAEIIAQAKADKVIVFKKRRRHNYRRKNGHRQQHTILRITAIGDEKAPPRAAKQDASVAEAPQPANERPAPEQIAPEQIVTDAAPIKPAAKARTRKAVPQEAPASNELQPQAPLKIEGAESELTDTPKGGDNNQNMTKAD